MASLTTRSIALTVVLLVGLTACGSDDDGAADDPSTSDPAQEQAEVDPADSGSGEVDTSDDDGGGESADPVTTGGSGTATLTMIDGTVYVFEMSTCETSNTDEFVLPDSYELSGTTADGEFRFSLTRAGLDEDFISQVGALEGEFDDGGQNPGIVYTADLDDEPLTVDGAIVSGAFLMNAIAPTRPHGDEVGVILDARC